MAGGYVKLFGSILQSTVWETPATTRCVWITMLAMSDMDGVVSASVPGLARMAGVTRAETEAALAAFLAPDPDSRTKDYDGRRIEEIDGGWRLLNHAKYRAMQTRDERREKDAERKRRARATSDADECGQLRTEADSPQSHAQSRPVTGSEADQKQIKDPEVGVSGARTRSNGDAESPIHPTPPDPERRRWQPDEWYQAYRIAWMTYAGTTSCAGSPTDWRYIDDLRVMLSRLSLDDALRAQANAQAMLARFFTDSSVAEGHPWSWFVQRFDTLRVARGPTRPPSRKRTVTEENVAALDDWQPPEVKTA